MNRLAHCWLCGARDGDHADRDPGVIVSLTPSRVSLPTTGPRLEKLLCQHCVQGMIQLSFQEENGASCRRVFGFAAARRG
ncbi:MAG: hypothetical protein HKN82_00690 [Akkermansiaceae bacterium]|nr:hypothetical protein [Akkermansiaceae bacterium]NNM30203.1 hypothetical protein [Akkermansiaceae bacterium]